MMDLNSLDFPGQISFPEFDGPATGHGGSRTAPALLQSRVLDMVDELEHRPVGVRQLRGPVLPDDD